MHIAQLNTNTQWGGGENQVLQLAAGLMARGEEVTLFAHPAGELMRRAREAGLYPKPLPSGPKPLARLLAAGGAELLHVHDSRGARLGAQAGRLRGIPVALSRRVASPLRQNWFSRRKYSRRNFSAVIAISHTVRKVFLDTSSYPSEDVFVVPTGIDTETLHAVTPDEVWRTSFGGRFLVGGVGKLSPKKNWSFLVRVAARMAQEDLDIQWVMAGDGEEKDSLQHLATELGVQDRVHLLGFREDNLRILKSIDLLFFPSVVEGASVTVRECMALGTPVVAVDAEGTMESLAGHGWGVADGDIEGAAAAVREALTNTELREDKCTGARQHAVDHYDYAQTVAGTVEVYNHLLAGTGPSALGLQ